jgi:hypothetical protein
VVPSVAEVPPIAEVPPVAEAAVVMMPPVVGVGRKVVGRIGRARIGFGSGAAARETGDENESAGHERLSLRHRILPWGQRGAE